MPKLLTLSRPWSHGILVGAAIVLIGVSLFRFSQSRALTRAAAAVGHTSEVLGELTEIGALRRERELLWMLWLARGEPNVLDSGRAVTPILLSHVARLKNLTADNPRQQSRINDFLATLAESPDAENARPNSPLNGNLMEQTVALGRRAEIQLRAIRTEELDLLAVHRHEASTAEAAWQRWAAVAVTFSVLLGLAAGTSLRHQRLREREVNELVHESERRLRAATEGGLDTFFLLAPIRSDSVLMDFEIVDTNRHAATIAGMSREAVLGRRWTDLAHHGWPTLPELTARVPDVLTTGQPSEFNHNVRVGDTSHSFRVLLATAGDAVALSCRDITEQVHAAEQLQQAEKLDALGRMASGVAHDFNNLLTVLRGECELILADGTLPAALRPDIENMIRAVDRAASLTQRLLAFSRKQVSVPRPLALDRAVDEMRPFLIRMLPSTVTVTTTHAAAMAPILLDPVHLDQILLNLAANARDAMPDGGELHVETSMVSLDQIVRRARGEVPPGRWVQLSVSDTGMGMSDQVVGRLFEPFFTTKAVGQGTGLGLASVHGITTQAGGHVTVESAVGKGTRFRLYFPPIPDSDFRPHREPARPTAPPVTPSAKLVLLAEDEWAVRGIMERLLVRGGYRVLTAESGEEALELFQTHLDEVDLLVTDMVMPGMSGQELAARATRERPDLKVLFVSGYVGDAVQVPGEVLAEGRFLQKPFTLDSLLERLARITAA
ncbi:MAG: ATP-binding protein [Gemmatimonadales bacterium]|nr:ATP-binding protein [Gemmatimonadales bacterium]